MSFSRWWTETVAVLGDVVPLPLLALFLLLAAGLAAAAWFWFPAWVPRRLPRWGLRWPRLRWPRRPRTSGTAGVDEPAPVRLDGDELPELPATAFTSLADQLAAQGRYAEAVRERLRAMVRELVDRRVVENRPGWTVTELAGAAGQARPGVDGPLRTAARIFSDLWYGQRPARPEHDAEMRALADQLDRALGAPAKAATPAGEGS